MTNQKKNNNKNKTNNNNIKNPKRNSQSRKYLYT